MKEINMTTNKIADEAGEETSSSSRRIDKTNVTNAVQYISPPVTVGHITSNKSLMVKALIQAQQEFDPVIKDSTNPHFKSRYASLDAVVAATRPSLNKFGIFVTQRSVPSNGAAIETVFLHESGEEWSSGPMIVPVSKQDAQGYGSALTYVRRYSWLAACGLAPEDDDGNNAVAPSVYKTNAPIIYTLDAIRMHLNSSADIKTKAKAWLGDRKLTDLSQDELVELRDSVS
jgi:hypothetical protein